MTALLHPPPQYYANLVLRAGHAFCPVSLERLGGGTRGTTSPCAPLSAQRRAAAPPAAGCFPRPVCSWRGKDPSARSPGGRRGPARKPVLETTIYFYTSSLAETIPCLCPAWERRHPRAGGSWLAKPSPPGTPVHISLPYFIFGSRNLTLATPFFFFPFFSLLRISSEASKNETTFLNATSVSWAKVVDGETAARAGAGGQGWELITLTGTADDDEDHSAWLSECSCHWAGRSWGGASSRAPHPAWWPSGFPATASTNRAPSPKSTGLAELRHCNAAAGPYETSHFPKSFALFLPNFHPNLLYFSSSCMVCFL